LQRQCQSRRRIERPREDAFFSDKGSFNIWFLLVSRVAQTASSDLGSLAHGGIYAVLNHVGKLDPNPLRVLEDPAVAENGLDLFFGKPLGVGAEKREPLFLLQSIRAGCLPL